MEEGVWVRLEHSEEEMRKDSQLQNWSQMPEGKAGDTRRHNLVASSLPHLCF